MRKTEIHGENMFRKTGHEPLTKIGGMLKIPVLKLDMWECRSRRKNEKEKKKGKPTEGNYYSFSVIILCYN